MQRLTFRRRLEHERGATAVVFALLLVPMLGFAAIAVDVGALYAERARLQVAADAAAIAVAQDCSRGNCGDMLATAQGLVTANDGEGTAAHPVLSSDPLSVTVTGSTPKEHWFAPVIGHDSTAVSATATVGWGGPSAGTAVLPLTFSWCAFTQQTGGGLPSGDDGPHHLLHQDVGHHRLHRAVGQRRPRWLRPTWTPTPATCEATSALGRAGGTPRPATALPVGLRRPPTSRQWVGRTVLLPLFDESGGTGSNAWYRVYGYAAFKLTGYHFGGQYSDRHQACGPCRTATTAASPATSPASSSCPTPGTTAPTPRSSGPRSSD